MFKELQNTLSETVSFEGIGLHSGKRSKITLIPTYENQGVILKE